VSLSDRDVPCYSCRLIGYDLVIAAESMSPDPAVPIWNPLQYPITFRAVVYAETLLVVAYSRGGYAFAACPVAPAFLQADCLRLIKIARAAVIGRLGVFLA